MMRLKSMTSALRLENVASAEIIYVYTNSQGIWETCSFFLSLNYSLLTLLEN